MVMIAVGELGLFFLKYGDFQWYLFDMVTSNAIANGEGGTDHLPPGALLHLLGLL